MIRNILSRHAGIAVAFALLWGAASAAGFALNPLLVQPVQAQATAPVNPGNPCNPDTAATANPCNPGNPDAAATANPCNPCNPDTAATVNPCNPDAATNPASDTMEKASDWWAEFRSWEVVTGFVKSNSHGRRLVRTYISPPDAAKIYRQNAKRVRERIRGDFRDFPPGTRIVQESWQRNEIGGVGKRGPLFIMRKEEPGYDEEGGNWRYGFLREDYTLINEGYSGSMQLCKDCHARAQSRDFVYASQR